MTWTPPSLAPLSLVPAVPPVEKVASPLAAESTLPGAHELESDSDFWALHDEIQVLGKGSYGTVKLVRVKSNNNLVAVKAVTKGVTPPEDGIDERKEAEALLLLRRANANTAPARIGGRKARPSRQSSRLSLSELQEEMRAAGDGKLPDSSPRTVVSALSPAASPAERRSVTLGAASSGVPSAMRRKSSSGSRSSSAMNIWQLQAAFFGGGPTGEPGERESSSTAETATAGGAATATAAEAEAGAAGAAVAAPSAPLAGEEEEEGGRAEERVGGVCVAEALADEGGASDTVRLLDVYESPGTLFLVMRAEMGGDLSTRLASLPGGRCDEAEARTHAAALLRAIEGMHARGIVHRDIKPANVLLSHEGEGRLGDFGLAETLPTAPADGAPPPLLTAVCGTHNNMAPEMVRCGHGEAAGYGTPSDMWQMGLLLFELLFGHHPLAHDTEVETLAAILAGEYSFPAATDVSDGAHDLVRRLLVSDPARRISATECLSHPWVIGASA